MGSFLSMVLSPAPDSPSPGILKQGREHSMSVPERDNECLRLVWEGKMNFYVCPSINVEFGHPLWDSFEVFGENGVNYNHLFETVTCFASQDEAFDWAQKIAFDNGIVLVKASNGSKNRKQPELQGSYFRCSRHFAGLDAGEKEFVRQKVRASIPPRDIKNGLHQRTPDKPQPTSAQIYSAAKKARREIRGTRNTAQQMLALAAIAKYVEWHKSDPETKELSHVFMSHPEAVKLFHAYPHVVLIDSTYKTNVYKIALVEVIGVIPCGSSFLIVAVLLPSESENDYR
ncbi:uncharacterized protein LOC141630446 [Silene latifolia]|uniref:uncharacterized protein LOC141630446 n=1 Tax=Silene latifolia TaxID=37657 RepID=UPI003D78769F